MQTIYLDHASTTYTDPRVLEAMLPFFSEKYGNAEAPHGKGKEAMIAIDSSRETIAKLLNCRASEIIFTGSATEANNLTIFGIAKASEKKEPGHIIISSIEHSSIQQPCNELEKEGWKITRLKVDKEGFVNPKNLEEAITPQTVLVSVMHANNEIGTIQPAAELGEICKKHKVPFHIDACQTAATQDLNTQKLNADLLTLNGGKIYGPKGVGALFVKRGIKLKPLIFGGKHERGMRAGTHNTPGIVGLAKALELVQKEKDKENRRLSLLRDKMMENLLKNIPGSKINGSRELRLPNNINITFPGINSQELILHLEQEGICVSTSAACTLGTTTPSSTLLAISLPKKDILSSIRISLGKINTEKEIITATKKITLVYKKLRNKKR